MHNTCESAQLTVTCRRASSAASGVTTGSCGQFCMDVVTVGVLILCVCVCVCVVCVCVCGVCVVCVCVCAEKQQR